MTVATVNERGHHGDRASDRLEVRDLRIIKKQTEALYANRHAAAQKFLSTWDWPAYVKHTDLSKPEDRALGRSQGRADRQDPCPDPTPRSARSRCWSASGLLRTRTPPRRLFRPAARCGWRPQSRSESSSSRCAPPTRRAPFGSMTPRSSPGFCWARSGEARSWWRPPEPVGTCDAVSLDACVDVGLCCDSSG